VIVKVGQIWSDGEKYFLLIEHRGRGLFSAIEKTGRNCSVEDDYLLDQFELWFDPEEEVMVS